MGGEGRRGVRAGKKGVGMTPFYHAKGPIIELEQITYTHSNSLFKKI